MLGPCASGEDKTNPRAQSGVTVPQKRKRKSEPPQEGWPPKNNPRTDLKVGHYTGKSGPPPSYGGQAEGGPYTGKIDPRKGLRPEGLSYSIGYRANGS